jgi:hypothetical protein
MELTLVGEGILQGVLLRLQNAPCWVVNDGAGFPLTSDPFPTALAFPPCLVFNLARLLSRADTFVLPRHNPRLLS